MSGFELLMWAGMIALGLMALGVIWYVLCIAVWLMVTGLGVLLMPLWALLGMASGGK
jgi:hypothetical protein